MNKTTCGFSNTRLYRIYQGMKQRCYNKNNSNYCRYGGKGVSICSYWLNEDGFYHFFNWAVNNGYNDDLTIDRMNAKGNYEPSNCRWVPAHINSKRKVEVHIDEISTMPMERIYPAVFHANEDGSYTITYPDLPGCISEGKSLGNAMHMAQSALSQWIEYLSDKKQMIPSASPIRSIPIEDGEFSSLIRADVKDGRAVKRTVSIPKWMDEKAIESGLSLSRVLQDALGERLAQ